MRPPIEASAVSSLPLSQRIAVVSPPNVTRREHLGATTARGTEVVRSDNGLVFASRLYRRLLTSYGLRQEFIHPHTPEQNGVVKAYHKTFKREAFGSTDSRRSSKAGRSSAGGSIATTPYDRTQANNLTHCLVLAGSLQRSASCEATASYAAAMRGASQRPGRLGCEALRDAIGARATRLRGFQTC